MSPGKCRHHGDRPESALQNPHRVADGWEETEGGGRGRGRQGPPRRYRQSTLQDRLTRADISPWVRCTGARARKPAGGTRRLVRQGQRQTADRSGHARSATNTAARSRRESEMEGVTFIPADSHERRPPAKPKDRPKSPKMNVESLQRADEAQARRGRPAWRLKIEAEAAQRGQDPAGPRTRVVEIIVRKGSAGYTSQTRSRRHHARARTTREAGPQASKGDQTISRRSRLRRHRERVGERRAEARRPRATSVGDLRAQRDTVRAGNRRTSTKDNGRVGMEILTLPEPEGHCS